MLEKEKNIFLVKTKKIQHNQWTPLLISIPKNVYVYRQ